MNLLVRIALAVWLAGISPILVAAAVSNGEPAQRTSTPRAQDSGRGASPAPKNGLVDDSTSQEQEKRQSSFHRWRRISEREQENEPNWLSPLATTSGRLKNELRYDTWRQTTSAGTTISTFGGGKGLEFIAAPRVQLLLGIPSYISHSAASPPDGFADLPLMLKFRIASANVSEGNYLITFLLSATAPTAARTNGSGEAVLTPTLAMGKGWGRFNLQTTFGANLPAADARRLGRQLLWNTAFQYRANWKLWPEVEVNSTYFQEGPNIGKAQIFLTPGLGFGRVRMYQAVHFSMAAGMQIAATHFHTYDHRGVLSVRFPF